MKDALLFKRTTMKCVHLRTLYVLLVFTICYCTSGCGRKSDGIKNLDERSFTKKALEMVSQRSGIKLPDGTRGINLVYQEHFVDDSFVVKVQLPVSSKDSLMKNIQGFRDEECDVDNPLSKKVLWWCPSEKTLLIKRQYSIGTCFVRVFLCNEGGLLMLYLEWIQL